MLTYYRKNDFIDQVLPTYLVLFVYVLWPTGNTSDCDVGGPSFDSGSDKNFYACFVVVWFFTFLVQKTFVVMKCYYFFCNATNCKGIKIQT